MNQIDALSTSDDQPTSAAHVTFRTTPEGPSFSVGVPAEHSGVLVGAVAVATCVVGSIVGPYLMARALHVTASDMPWQVQFGLIILAALLPLAYFLIGRRS